MVHPPHAPSESSARAQLTPDARRYRACPGQSLLDACTAAGAVAKPLLEYDGAHEVTLPVADAFTRLLSDLMEPVAID